MFPNNNRLKKIRKNEKFEKFEKSEKFRGNKLSRTKNLEKFRGINFRGKGQKTRNRESFWPRKFLTLKYSLQWISVFFTIGILLYKFLYFFPPKEFSYISDYFTIKFSLPTFLDSNEILSISSVQINVTWIIQMFFQNRYFLIALFTTLFFRAQILWIYSSFVFTILKNNRHYNIQCIRKKMEHFD